MKRAPSLHTSVLDALRRGQARRVIPRLRQQIAATPADPTPHVLLGRALAAIGNVPDAIPPLETAVRLAPGDCAAWSELAQLQAKARRYGDCVESLRHALTLEPGNAGYAVRLGHALRRGGRPEEAAELLSATLRQAPGHQGALTELGMAYWTLGRPAEALPLLRGARAAGGGVFVAAAVASLEAELDAGVRLRSARSRHRVALHMNRPFHHGILAPVFEALRPGHHVLLCHEPAIVRRFRPDVILFADAQGERLRALCPGAHLVFVRHGLITKRHLGIAARGADFIAGVSSPGFRDWIAASESIAPDRLWVTGHVPMDPLFRGYAMPLPPGLLTGRRTILFAPTWNPRLSGLSMLGDAPVSAIRAGDDDLNLIIKLHPNLSRERPDALRRLRRAVRGRRNVWLVHDPAADALGLLPHADLLLSDASSVIMAFLALDRPLVLLNHPERQRDPGYDADGIEWRWRDMAEEVNDPSTLARVIASALAAPQARAPQRARYRQILFGDLTDGRAAERIAARVAALPAVEAA